MADSTVELPLRGADYLKVTRFSARRAGVVLAALIFGCSGSAVAATAGWHTLSDPINPAQLTDMPFGTDSPWLQPWRSSLTTRPASALLNAVGIDFNMQPSEAASTAELLHDSGFRRARIEFPWGAMSYADPSQVADPATYDTLITAMRVNHLRPLILLNANSGGPGPATTSQVTLLAPASTGDTTVLLSPGDAANVVPGLTGFDAEDANGYPERPGDLITSVNAAGLATLSRPLPMDLPAGPTSVTTLRYAPFSPPTLADGAPNPRFQATLAGWLTYAKSVADFVRQVYGSSNFDIEVWNELTFGSAFLDETNYYSPVPDPGATGDVDAAILAATVKMLHDPANGLPGVKVGDGFANEEPWPSGVNVPAGTDAIDKHPYPPSKTMPADQEPGIEPLNTFGEADDFVTTDAAGLQQVNPGFIPSYRVLMPEYGLTGIQTETLMRDLSPITTDIYGIPHGAATHPAGAAAPKMWITEDNLAPTQAEANGMPAADADEFQAKAALRFFAAYASEGVQAIDLFSADGGACCQLIDPAYFSAVDADPASDPEQLAGQTMEAVRRLTASLSGVRPAGRTRQLTLQAISQEGNAAQFAGNGSATMPSLYNRDMLAFFPFQVNEHRFVSAVYVMTTDLSHLYTSTPAPGLTPYDMPPEPFRLTIGGVLGRRAKVSLSDPLTGRRVSARIVSRTASSIVVQVPATDSPRMLTIQD